ncbi:MAG: DUF58 domain-containing protein [Haloplanus sp.]
MRVKLTLRGFVAVGVAVVGTWLSVRFGPRSLNAVVLPTVVALVAAVVQVATFDRPELSRTPPPNGFPGDGGRVELRFETDAPVTGTVVDGLPPGVDGDASVTTLVGDGPVGYDVTYRRRGERAFGPTRLRARDVLGLAERTFQWREPTSVVVYPRVFDLSSSAYGSLRERSDRGRRPDRGEFDHLREYARGDTLRDVHWKSSAKRDDLVVKSFGSDRERTAVTLAASADPGHADAMAEAAASLGTALLADDVPVSLVTPDGRLDVGVDGGTRLLEHLARVGSGDVDADADVTVTATAEATTVRVGGETTTFESLRRPPADADRSPVESEEVAA